MLPLLLFKSQALLHPLLRSCRLHPLQPENVPCASPPVPAPLPFATEARPRSRHTGGTPLVQEPREEEQEGAPERCQQLGAQSQEQVERSQQRRLPGSGDPVKPETKVAV